VSPILDDPYLARCAFPVGDRVRGTVSAVPLGPGRAGVPVDLGQPPEGWVDVLSLPDDPTRWPVVGRTGLFEVCNIGRARCFHWTPGCVVYKRDTPTGPVSSGPRSQGGIGWARWSSGRSPSCFLATAGTRSRSRIAGRSLSTTTPTRGRLDRSVPGRAPPGVDSSDPADAGDIDTDSEAAGDTAPLDSR
jgi:hypothetical protein